MFDENGDLLTDEWGDTLRANAGIRDSALSLHAKVVAYTLTSRAQPIHDEGWMSWPSIGLLARDCGMSRARVFTALAELRDAGLIRWEQWYYGQSNRYTLDYLAMMELRTPARTSRRR